MEEWDEGTFLTFLNADKRLAREKQIKREDLLGNVDSGQQILKLHGDLQSLADDLDDRVGQKLRANEQAFEMAFKSHMLQVQKDINKLEQKADKEETKNRRDTKIRSLEKELDWYMNEALRLDELCKKYKKQLDRWKGKSDALEDDRQFLENQIKNANKNNKKLRADVEKAQTSAYSALVSNDEPKALPSSTQVQESEGRTGDQPLAIEDGYIGDSGMAHELEERYQKYEQRLRRQLEAEKRLSAKMRAVSDKNFSEPSELESFFLQCVDRVKADIDERRQRAQVEKIQNKARPRGQAAMEPVVPALPPVSFDDFTATDRRQVVELLLSSKQVLQFLQDKLLPPAPGTSKQYAADIGS